MFSIVERKLIFFCGMFYSKVILYVFKATINYSYSVVLDNFSDIGSVNSMK